MAGFDDIEGQKRDNSKKMCSSEDCGPLVCCLGGSGVCLLISYTIFIVAASTRVIGTNEVALSRSVLDPVLLPDVVEDGVYSVNKFPVWPDLVIWPNSEEQLIFSANEGDKGEIQCNSIDGLRVLLDVSLQYKVNVSALYDLTATYKNYEIYSDFLEDVARATIQHSCGLFTAEEFQTKRNEVANAVSEGLKTDIKQKLSADVTQAQLRNIMRPEEYDDKVREKENALNDIALANAERAQAVTKANTEFRKAELEALRDIDSAKRDAIIVQNQATADAEATLDNYQALIQVYVAIKDQAGLTEEGILTYIANEVFAGQDLDTTIALTAPSQISYQTEL